MACNDCKFWGNTSEKYRPCINPKMQFDYGPCPDHRSQQNFLMTEYRKDERRWMSNYIESMTTKYIPITAADYVCQHYEQEIKHG